MIGISTITRFLLRRKGPVWFVIQEDRDHTLLGVRSVFLSKEEAEQDLEEANEEFREEILEAGWPIWAIIEKQVYL